MNIEVRQHNGQCEYGDWRPVYHEDVPEWVGDMAADEIAETDADAGQVNRAGSIWVWRKVS